MAVMIVHSLEVLVTRSQPMLLVVYNKIINEYVLVDLHMWMDYRYPYKWTSMVHEHEKSKRIGA